MKMKLAGQKICQLPLTGFGKTENILVIKPYLNQNSDIVLASACKHTQSYLSCVYITIIFQMCFDLFANLLIF